MVFCLNSSIILSWLFSFGNSLWVCLFVYPVNLVCVWMLNATWVIDVYRYMYWHRVSLLCHCWEGVKLPILHPIQCDKSKYSCTNHHCLPYHTCCFIYIYASISRIFSSQSQCFIGNVVDLCYQFSPTTDSLCCNSVTQRQQHNILNIL